MTRTEAMDFLKKGYAEILSFLYQTYGLPPDMAREEFRGMTCGEVFSMIINFRKKYAKKLSD